MAVNPTLPYRQISSKIWPGAEFVRCSDLEGGLSAQVTAIEAGLSGGRVVRAVVRRYGAADRKRNPDIARDQFELHLGLHRNRLAVPKPLLFDDSGRIFDVPFLVLEYIEGSTELDPQNVEGGIRQLAAHLAKIHKISGTASIVSMLPPVEQLCLSKLGYCEACSESGSREKNVTERPASEERVRELLRSVMPLPRRNPPVLIHGDYWPGNVLWKDGCLAAVIDWEDAAVGDPLVDVSNARLEILWAFGPAGMEEFTRHYLEQMPEVDFADLPYWDLYAAIRLAPSEFACWGLEAEKENITRERHREFVDKALSALPVDIAHLGL